ncbi:hypothetical protein U9M48_009771 [Paspalum notatum var. saurae]|uniref:Auxin-repressed protein n=1 Tax=Paspalum notatum var. saurae TaxID=547442 RepID=A0AAQ3WFE5_PASNO
MLEKLWDDVVAGPRPETGLEKLRKAATTRQLVIDAKDADAGGSSSYKRTQSMPSTPTTPVTPSSSSTTPRGASNVWRSVFHPGSNLATKGIGANLFDRPQQPNSPTVYDWLYSDETRSNHR